MRTGITAQRVSAAGTRSSSRRTTSACVRFLAVLGGRQETRDGSVTFRQEDPQRHTVARAAVLLDAPAVELAAQPRAQPGHSATIRTATSSVSSEPPLKTPRVGGTSA